MPQWHNHCQRLSSLGAGSSQPQGWSQRRETETGLKVVLPQRQLRLHRRKAFAKCSCAAIYMLNLATGKQKALEKAPAGDRSVTLMHRDSITSHTWRAQNKVLAPALL